MNEPEEVPITTARKTLAHLVERAYWRGERFVICVHGEPRAQVVPLDKSKARAKQRGKRAPQAPSGSES